MSSLIRHRTLYLVRHGAIVNSGGRSYVGQIERPLSEKGIRQALRLRVLLEQHPIAHVYCSDLIRSTRTAEAIAESRNLDVRVRRDLREISLGDWEGRTFAEIRRRFPQEFKARGADLEHWRPPGGESFGDCRERVLPAFRAILDSSRGDVLVVGHAGVNRILLCEVLGMSIANLFRIGQDYGCLNVIDYSETGCHLRLANYTPWGMAAESRVPSDEPHLEMVHRGAD